MKKSYKTLLDPFDFSLVIDQDTFSHIIRYLLTDREREIIKCRLGFGIDNRLTLAETALKFHLFHDTVIAIEKKIAKFLKRNGVPFRPEIQQKLKARKLAAKNRRS
jgi:DNA-directed RNA polymerase sigma subunit (sigma70/sigma32)